VSFASFGAYFGGRSSYVATVEVPHAQFYQERRTHFHQVLFSLLTELDPVKKYLVKPVKLWQLLT
jgi:hypothetical protein